MKCQVCGTGVTIVTDSREVNKFCGSIRRRRECKNGHKFSTYEINADILSTCGILKSVDASRMISAANQMLSAAKNVRNIIELLDGADIEIIKDEVNDVEKKTKKLWEGMY